MDKQDTFQSSDTTIDLSKVIAFEEVPQPVAATTEDVTLLVQMADGSSATVHGEGDARAFAQAMDNHLGVNLV